MYLVYQSIGTRTLTVHNIYTKLQIDNRLGRSRTKQISEKLILYHITNHRSSNTQYTY